VLRDLHRAELLSFLIALVGWPRSRSWPPSPPRLSGVTVQATSVVLLVGLAVGIDYSMMF